LGKLNRLAAHLEEPAATQTNNTEPSATNFIDHDRTDKLPPD